MAARDKPKAGHGKGTRKAGGKAAAKPAASSTRSRGRKTDVRLSPLDRVNRARAIAARRAKTRPDSWVTIAKDEGLSERQARRIYDDFLAWDAVRTAPARLISQTLDTIEGVLLELDDVILEAAKQGNLNARVGAARLMLEAVAGRWDVMRAAGLIPDHMRRWQDAQEARAIFDAMTRVLKRHNIGDEVIDELYSAASLPDVEGRLLEGQAA
jgi:hypothetical protein